MKADNYHSTLHSGFSIAVLPFVNMSSDEDNEYFSDGITEEIINALTKVEGLKVIARTSSFAFKGKSTDIRHIADELGVSTVLEGSVRKFQNRIRITAQLINSKDGMHFWSQNFDREMDDIFKLQDEISLLIADQIRENYGHFYIQEHLVQESTKSMQAYELYLRGHFNQLKWDAESILRATGYYEQSIKIDPDFARSYFGLVQSYGLLASWGFMSADDVYPKAFDNFLIAKDLDETLPEYGMSYIVKTFWMDWDFRETYSQLMKTLERHPRYTDALEAMAELFISLGCWVEAEAYIRQAMDVDPLSANHHYTLASIYYYQKKYQIALRHLEQTLLISPGFVLARALKSLCLTWLNQKAEFEKLIENSENADLQRTFFKIINEHEFTVPKEKRDMWINIPDDKNQMVPYELYILANSSYKKEAFELLGKYVSQKRGQVINFRHDPSLVALQTYETFDKLFVPNFKISEVKTSYNEDVIDNDPISAELDAQMDLLMHTIKEETPYLNPSLSLRRLADQIKLHPNKLSYLINERAGMNFNEFINQFRLTKFKELATDPKNGHLTLLGIAYESGFNSKSSFNNYFRKVEGTTPGNWLKRKKLGL